MSFHPRCFTVLVVLFLTPEYGAGNMNEDVEIPVTGFWKKIFEEENKSNSTLAYTHTWSDGLRTTQTNEKTVTATHSLEGGIKTGDILQIVSLSFSYKMENSVENKQVLASEIKRSKEQTVMFEVAPWTKLVRWQFVADIAGNEFDYSHTVTVSDNTKPEALYTRAIVRMRKMIRLDETRFRMRHKETEKYVIMVERRGWPAATLGLSDRYYFTLEDYGDCGIRIKTLNSTAAGYDYLYTWRDRWVYGDVEGDHRCKKSYWVLNKAPPLYEGDALSFRSKLYPSSYLCYNPASTSTDVECRDKKEDLWILEVV